MRREELVGLPGGLGILETRGRLADAGKGTTRAINVNRTPLGLNVSWTPELVNLSADVVIRAQVSTSDRVGEFFVAGNGEPPVHQFALTNAIDPATAGSSFPNGTYIVRVRGCNVLGCTATSDPVTVSVATPIAIPPSTVIPPQGTTPKFGSTPPQTIGP